MYNLATPENKDKYQQAQFQRVAGLMVNDFRRGKLTRGQIEQQLNNKPEQERETLRKWINNYLSRVRRGRKIK